MDIGVFGIYESSFWNCTIWAYIINGSILSIHNGSCQNHGALLAMASYVIFAGSLLQGARKGDLYRLHVQLHYVPDITKR